MIQAGHLLNATCASLDQARSVQAPHEVQEGLKRLQGLVKTEVALAEEGGNMGYLQAVYQCAGLQPGLGGLLVPMGNGENTLSKSATRTTIDLIADWGARWVKVSWRRPEALTRQLAFIPKDGLTWPREADFFHSIQMILQVIRSKNKDRILPIRLHVHLPRGTCSQVRTMLLHMGVARVVDALLPEKLVAWSFPGFLDRIPPQTMHILLDTTTLMALVSDACHVPPSMHPAMYPIEAMRLQMAQEANGPFPPLLTALRFIFKGRSIHVIRSSLTSFLSILRTMGGKDEISRAAQLFPSYFPDQALSDIPFVLPDHASSHLPSTSSHTISVVDEGTAILPEDILCHLPDTLLLTANRRLAQRYEAFGGHVWTHPPRSLCQVARLACTLDSLNQPHV